MIFNYIKIAWRNISKSKFFSFVNIFGLSVGLASCMLIALYLNYETSYDNYHKNVGNLYEVGTTIINKGEKGDNKPLTSPPIAAALKQEFPEVEETARLLPLVTDEKNLVQYSPADGEKKSFLEENGFIADATFFDLFTYNFIEGNPINALKNPNSIVISESMA
ncbi:MAG TPA: ABC transporter permease, partial [Mucilaginibacter sp.]|nr:ABC transporter permease [Mucilaginibacter sp.]